MDEAVVKRMAALMSINCVRKTYLDDLLQSGKISSDDVAMVLKQSNDKLYTFLHYLLTVSEEEKQAFLQVMSTSYASGWPDPELCDVFTQAVELYKSQEKD